MCNIYKTLTANTIIRDLAYAKERQLRYAEDGSIDSRDINLVPTEIYNARNYENTSIDMHGFTLATDNSQHFDFSHDAAIYDYYPHLVNTLKEVTGCREVHILHHINRSNKPRTKEEERHVIFGCNALPMSKAKYTCYGDSACLS